MLEVGDCAESTNQRNRIELFGEINDQAIKRNDLNIGPILHIGLN